MYSTCGLSDRHAVGLQPTSWSVRLSCAVIREGENWSYTVKLLLHLFCRYAYNRPTGGQETVLIETC